MVRLVSRPVGQLLFKRFLESYLSGALAVANMQARKLCKGLNLVDLHGRGSVQGGISVLNLGGDWYNMLQVAPLLIAFFIFVIYMHNE